MDSFFFAFLSLLFYCCCFGSINSPHSIWKKYQAFAVCGSTIGYRRCLHVCHRLYQSEWNTLRHMYRSFLLWIMLSVKGNGTLFAFVSYAVCCQIKLRDTPHRINKNVHAYNVAFISFIRMMPILWNPKLLRIVSIKIRFHIFHSVHRSHQQSVHFIRRHRQHQN